MRVHRRDAESTETNSTRYACLEPIALKNLIRMNDARSKKRETCGRISALSASLR